MRSSGSAGMRIVIVDRRGCGIPVGAEWNPTSFF